MKTLLPCALIAAGAFLAACDSGDESSVDASVKPAAAQTADEPRKASRAEQEKNDAQQDRIDQKAKFQQQPHDSSIQSRGASKIAPPRNPVSNTPTADGEIEFDKMTEDFGRVAFGEALKTQFKFTNAGSERLVIERVRSSCGCTVPELTQKEYDPGESGVIDVTFKPKGVGRQTKSITVITNAREQQRVVLTVSADAVDVVRTSPRLIQFHEVLKGTSQTQDLVLESIDPDMEVISAEFKRFDDGYMTAEVVEEIDPEIQVKNRDPDMPGLGLVRVTVTEDAPMGRMLRPLSIVTRAKMEGEQFAKEREITVNAHVTVVGDLKSSPATLRIPTVDRGEEFKGSFTVTRRSGKPFYITNLSVERSTIPGVEVRSEEWENNDGVKGYRIWVSGQDEDFRGVYRGHIKIETDIANEEPLAVAFSGAVRAASKRQVDPRSARRR